MNSTSDLTPDGPSAAAARSSLRLARGVRATWFYTAAALVIFELGIVLVTVAVMNAPGIRPLAAIIAVGMGGLMWVVSTVALLIDYRHRTDAAPQVLWRRQVLPLLIAVIYGVTAGAVSGLWIVTAVPLLQSLMLLNWQSGIRLRMMLLATALLVGLAVIDTNMTGIEDTATYWWTLVTFSILLPAMSVTSLWWWDVMVRLDQARASESRLAATQERLRVATDVHDLQGHHLQVIALQLELAERLSADDPDAAVEQLRAARVSVAEAQQGTRDLAMRFRSVPLSDEIANAIDLLRAAGTSAEATVDAGADRAPASVLGPVIRETTTNVLRHGGGNWAQLSLLKTGETWQYKIVNDTSNDSPPPADGSGLEGIARRSAEVGGTLEVQRGKQEFTVLVNVPAEQTQ